MSTDMAKIYNSHNFIPREMVTLLSGRLFPLSACKKFHYFYPETGFGIKIMKFFTRGQGEKASAQQSNHFPGNEIVGIVDFRHIR